MQVVDIPTITVICTLLIFAMIGLFVYRKVYAANRLQLVITSGLLI